MTHDEARECASILANAYGMGARRVDWYVDMLVRFPVGATAEFLEGWVEREKAPPTIAAVKAGVRQRLETLGVASPTFAPRGERMERLIVWRSLLEDPTSSPRERDDAHDRIRWMDPPCLPHEWREARHVADARWSARNEQRLGEGKPPYRPRPPLAFPEVPGPADPQPILSREAHQAGFAALAEGMRRKLNPEQMESFVLGAVRAAAHPTSPAPAEDDW